MPYKIPDEQTLSKAIELAFIQKTHLESQRELVEAVNKELFRINQEYRASGERIRRIGVENGLIEITIDYHEVEGELPETCPVCKNAMSPIRNMSLDGEIVEVKRKCTVCSYNVGRKMLMPSRYGFSRIKGNCASDGEKAIRDLKKAQAKLKEASVLVKNALYMTEMASRSEDTLNLLKQLSESNDCSWSINNLIRDLKSLSQEDPIWTDPFRSVKNIDRKDI